jgi:hypothetical protein
MNDESYLIAFKAVCNFVNDLNIAFGNRYKPLKLYNRLISKTQICHDTAIKKHLTLFTNFCISNREPFSERDNKKLINTKIEYSSNVYFDINTIFGFADDETKNIIWRHLLTISAIVDPAGKAKEMLKKIQEENKDQTDETDFLSDIISKVEKNVRPDTENPLEAVTSIMQSGVFTDLLSGMQNGLSSGKLDMSKLLGTVQKMVTKLSNEAGGDPQTTNMINSMSGMLGNIQNGTPPDLSGMMSMMSGMMSNMAVAPKIEEINENVKE